MTVYLLFAGERYYPSGGVSDLVGVYPSEAATRAALRDPDDGRPDWIQIVRIDATGASVVEGSYTDLASDARHDLTGRTWTLAVASERDQKSNGEAT